MKELGGKVAVVTGGASGIGRGLVRAFANAGMTVVVADIDVDAALNVASEVGGIAYAVDTSSLESVQSLADEVFEELGAVHLLCNNAGVSVAGPLTGATIDDWRWVMSVNVFGPVHGLLTFLPRMIAQPGQAHIVNTASVSGLAPMPGLAVYSTSEFALVGLSEAMRHELAPHDIGVTVICPGSVRTRILEADRNRPPELGAAGPVLAPAEASPHDAIDPDELGERVRRAVQANDFYLTAFSASPRNVAMPALVRDRCAAVLAALPA